MKKNLLSAAFVLATIGTTLAQTTVTSNWFIRPLDIIYGATDSLVSSIVVSPGSTASQIWNFTALNGVTKDTFEVFTAASGSAAASFPSATLRVPFLNGDGYLRKTGTKVEIIGYSGDPGLGSPVKVPFNDPLEFQVAPLNFGMNMTNTSAFRFTINSADYPQIQALLASQLPAGTNADSIRLTRSSRDEDQIDAFGTINLPANLSYDVLRVHRQSYNDTKIEIRVILFGGLLVQWIDPSTLSGGGGGTTIPGVGKDTTNSYLFISNDERQAVATITMNRLTNQPQSVRYLYAPTVVATEKTAAEALELTAQPNPATNEVRIKIGALPTGSYRLRLNNLLGATVYQAAVQGNETLPIDVNSYANGAYFYSILDEKGTVLATKRLTIAHH